MLHRRKSGSELGRLSSPSPCQTICSAAISLLPPSSARRSAMDFAKRRMARPPLLPSRSTKSGAIASSFRRLSHEMRLIGDDHFDIADQSPGARVGVELDGIAGDVEIGAADSRALLRSQKTRFQIKN